VSSARLSAESAAALQVKVHAELNTVNLERLLHFYGPRLERTRKVHFDLSASVWLGIYELSMLVSWMLELKGRGFQVDCTFPTSSDVSDFLVAFRFDSTLRSNGVVPRLHSDTQRHPLLLLPHYKPYFPLTFVTADRFERTLEELRQKGAQDTFFSDVSKSQVVASGVMRDIVLAELGDNLFMHGKGALAHLVVSKHRAPEDPERYWEQKTRTPASAERDYFRKIAGREYLCVVVSDCGDGIANTIRTAYLNDKIIGKVSPEPSEAQLLQYAFLYHTTRRSTQERVGKLAAQLASSDAPPPPTGLYRLLQNVKAFGAFMLVRSGRTIAVCDALATGDPPVEAFTSVAQIKELAHFSGTQFKIYFPLEIPRIYKSAALSPKASIDHRTTFVCVAVDHHFEGVREGDGDTEPAAALHALDSIQMGQIQAQSTSSAVLITGMDKCYLSSKALHYLLLEIARRQTPRHPHVLLGANERTLETASTLFRPGDSESLGLTFISRLFEAAYLSPKTGWSRDPRGPAVSGIGLQGSTSNQFLAIPALLSKAATTYREYLEHRINELLSDRAVGMYQPKVVVLLRSRKYSKGFFDLFRALEHQNLRHLLAEWLSVRLLQHSATVLMAIGRVPGTLAEDALEMLRVSASPASALPVHVPVLSQGKPVEIVRAALAISRGARVLIFTDVVGTAQSLRNVLRYVPAFANIQIAAIVDARAEGEAGDLGGDPKYPMTSALRVPLTYHTDLPLGTKYSSVHRIDPASGRLIAPPREGMPLWRHSEAGDEEDTDTVERTAPDWFIRNVVAPVAGCRFGHFQSRDAHLTYLFDIARIASAFDSEISNVVAAHVRGVLTGHNRPPEPDAIIHPADNPGLDAVANAVARHFPSASVVPIPREILRPSFIGQFAELGKTVVALDDALVSGTTVVRMYEIAEQGDAEIVLAYVLLRRGRGSAARQTLRFSGFGDATVQCSYLADMPIPTYRPGRDCPACAEQRALEECAENFSECQPIASLATSLARELEPKDVELALALQKDEQTADQVHATLRVRWLLESARWNLSLKDELHHAIKSMARLSSPGGQYLLSVLWMERKLLIHDKSFAEEVLDSTIHSDLSAIAADVLSRAEDDTPHSVVQGGLAVLFCFDLPKATSLVPQLIGRSQWRAHHLLITCLTLLELRAHLQSHSHVLFTLRRCRTMNGSSPLTDHEQSLLATVEDAWASIQNSNQSTAAHRLHAYRELSGRAFHECGNFVTNIAGAANAVKVDVHAIVANWGYLSRDLLQARALWKNAVFDQSAESTLEVEAAFAGLEELRVRVDPYVKGIELRTPELKDPRRSGKHRSQLAGIVSDLNRSLKRLSEATALLQVNVKSLLSAVLSQKDELLSSGGVTYEKEITEAPTVAYGESALIAICLHNLFSNAVEAAAHKLLVGIRISDSREVIEVTVMDNGQGLPDPFEYGTGLENVDRIMQSYGGGFTIESIAADAVSGMRTRATLMLPRIRSSQKD